MICNNIQTILHNKIIQKLFKALIKSKDDQVLLVGGINRDFILYGHICNDIDMATNLTPEECISRLSDMKQGKILTYALEYGSITLILNEYEITITTFRKDINSLGRSAIVEQTNSLLEDAKRRDFTINAIYLDQKGNIYDFCNGISDIKSGIVKFIGSPEQRIKEDYLRILRYFRFSSITTTKYCKDTINHISNNLDGLRILSKERITKELSKMAPNPFMIDAIQQMSDSGVIQGLFGKNININIKTLQIYTKQLLNIWLSLGQQGNNTQQHAQNPPLINNIQQEAHKLLSNQKQREPLIQHQSTLISLSRTPVLLPIIMSIKPRSKIQNIIDTQLRINKSDKRIIALLIKNPFIITCKNVDMKLKNFLVNNSNKINDISVLCNMNPFCYKEIQDFIQSIKPLPISGKDILRETPQIKLNNIRKVLMQLTHSWIKSNFQCTKSELESSISTIVEQKNYFK